jgi:glycosyltransferase involved in cell wall biosynthesis
MAPPSRPLRILVTCDAVGGVWTYATNLARCLAQPGHRVHLVTLGPSPTVEQRDAVAEVAGVTLETTELPLEWMDPAGLHIAATSRELRRIEHSFNPNVIHLNGFREALSGWSAPTLVVAHSCVQSWWRACRGEAPHDACWAVYAENVRAGLETADAWVAPSAAFGRMVEDIYRPRRHARIIHNGLPEGPPSRSKAPLVLAAGRFWDEAKNVGTVLEAAPDVNWPVLIAGDTDAPGLDVSTNVCSLGILPHGELLEQMSRAAVFVSAALYEPFGLTPLEAAQRGCALVLSDIPTFKELWSDAAIFVDPRDASAIAAALNRVIGDATLLRTLQDAAERRAQSYSPARMTEEYSTLYDDLADRQRASREPHELELAS